MVNLIKKFILNKSQLLKIAELDLPQQAISEFEIMYKKYIEAGDGKLFSYNSSYPLYLFLNYINENKDVLIHGSNKSSISSLEPKESSLFNGKPIKAVFASSDGVWSLFFAVVNRKATGSLRNFCISIPTNKGVQRYYYFSINNDNSRGLWTNGTIYFLSRSHFKQGGIRDEWVCEQIVKPLSKLTVTPEDFPFLEDVSRHKETDSMLKSIIKAFFIKK